MLQIDREEVLKEILENNYKKVLFQGPDGLRNQLVSLIRYIKRKAFDVDIYLDGDRSFGACDIPYSKAARLGAEVIFHFGHTEFRYTTEQYHTLESKIPVKYFPVYFKGKISDRLYTELINRLRKVGSLAVIYSIQYKNQYRDIVDRLQKAGINIVNYRGPSDDINKWQVIGCDLGYLSKVSNEAEAALVVSSGLFHGLGVGLYTGLPTLVLDVHKNKIFNIEKEILRFRSLIMYNISRARDAQSFGVIISTKSFQFNHNIAKSINDYINNHLGKYSVIITLDYISSEELAYFPSLDAFIQTACPRISIDDLISHNKPILNIEQFQIFIGKKRFDEVYPWKEPRLFQD